jgi:FKBP-type peptidyl-prolyl cis-trans isomerase FkpA
MYKLQIKYTHKMKRIFTVIVLFLTLLSCKKTSSPACPYTDSPKTATAAEIAALQAYINANALPATQHSSGIFYTINTSGTATSVGLCSTVYVRYIGRLLSTGAVFENKSTTTVSFTLGEVITGWQKGIPLVGKTGTITLYIPPSLAYGASAAGTIPANSYLIFDVQLIDVQ